MAKSGFRRGFTLIELLVVISIIALLLAILVPALNEVKKQAQRIVCSASFKQISLGMFMYVDSNNNMLPHSVIAKDTVNLNPPGGEWYPGLWFWQQLIADYVNVKRKDRGWGEYSSGYEIFYCPSMKKTKTWKPIWGHYGVSETFCTDESRGLGGNAPFSYLKVRQSSNRILALDAGCYGVRGDYISGPKGYFFYVPSTILPDTDPAAWSGTPITPWLQDDYMNGRHDKKVNILWADGHGTPKTGKEIGDRWRVRDRSWWKK